MRGHLVMKLLGIVVTIILTIMGARAFNFGSSSSSLNPATVLHNDLSGLCANQAATAQASGDESTQTLQVAIPANLSNVAQAAGLSSGSVSCATTTTVGP